MRGSWPPTEAKGWVPLPALDRMDTQPCLLPRWRESPKGSPWRPALYLPTCRSTEVTGQVPGTLCSWLHLHQSFIHLHGSPGDTPHWQLRNQTTRSSGPEPGFKPRPAWLQSPTGLFLPTRITTKGPEPPNLGKGHLSPPSVWSVCHDGSPASASQIREG